MLAAILLCLAGLSGVLAESATPQTDADAAEPVPAARELNETIEGAGDLTLSTITVSDLLQMADLASVAHQQQIHVRKSAGLSLFVPGLGQYTNGETGKGFAFFAADLAIRGTAAAVGYFLLPASVRIANLNYLQTPIVDIETRWKNLTVAEFLPSAAVAASAGILSAIVRHIAARDARDLAMQAIADGTVVFEPIPLMSTPAVGR
ncbi:MAG: hypothetical protein KOO61_04455 [Spirochaetales bacterium]|nr:hypothetical protein [Spirochaetales bacterium]